MTPQDMELVRTWAAGAPMPLRLTLIPGGAEPHATHFAEFCSQLQVLAPGLNIKKEGDAPIPGPAIMIGRHANIVYRAIPGGRELPPFLEALAAVRMEDEAAENRRRLADLDLPVLLSLYIAPQCPHCPDAVRRLIDLAAASSRINLTIIDGVLFESDARGAQIRSVPTLILDGGFRWTGRIDPGEVLDTAVHRDPMRISAASLRRMLESGEAAQAAQIMAEHNAVFPALFELLAHPRWSVRLGAMVTVEYLAESAPVLAAGLADPLWERFSRMDKQIQGDLVQVLGQIGAGHHLEMVLRGGFDEEVKQAAAEELQSRGQ